MKIIKFILIIIALIQTNILVAQDIPRNILYAQSTFSTMPDAPEMNEIAWILKDLGYQGIESDGPENFYQTLEEAGKAGIALTANYHPMYIPTYNDFPSWQAETKKMISSSGKGTIFCFNIPEIEPVQDKNETERMVVGILREMAVYAENYGVKICTYPHVNTYCETLSHSVKLARAVDHSNCGAMLTLCHLLKVEGAKHIGRKLRKSVDYLFAVTISGADEGNTMDMSWDKLIQPLGQGTFDTYQFLEQLWDTGYDGPVGVQFYGIKEDARTTLESTVQVWENYRKQYINTHKDGKIKQETIH